jgi:hypothetical protein
MNNKTRIHSALTIVAVLLLAWPSMAVAQPTTSDFQQAVAAYQQSPSDAAAEKVIKLAVALDQPPPIPTEARKHFVRGATLAKDAKSPDDFSQVSEEFSQAVRIAPWWPEALYNLALAQGAAGDYAKGITSLQHYQMFKLSDAEAQAVQDKIWGFEAKQEKVVKDKELAAATRAEEERRKAYESSPEGIAAKQLEEERQWLKRLDGAIYSVRHGNHYPSSGEIHMRRKGFAGLRYECRNTDDLGFDHCRRWQQHNGKWFAGPADASL